MVDVNDVAVMALGHAYDFHALYRYIWAVSLMTQINLLSHFYKPNPSQQCPNPNKPARVCKSNLLPHHDLSLGHILFTTQPTFWD